MTREFLFLALVLSAQPASGHTTSGGQAGIDLDTGRVEARLTELDLLQLPDLRTRSKRELGERVRDRIMIEADGSPLKLFLEGVHARDGLVFISLRSSSVPAHASVRVTLTLFADVDPEHRTLVRLVHGGESRFRELPDGLRWQPSNDSLHEPLAAAQLGISHVLAGWDHLLFVAVLVLGAAGWRAALVAVSWFTLGHALSLAALTLGITGAPASVVEPLIALSIVYAGAHAASRAEDQGSTSQRSASVVVVVLCGTVHGLGFGSALRELGLDGLDAITPMLSFNLGVELAQLSWAVLSLGAIHVASRLEHGALFKRVTATLIAAVGATAFLIRL